MNQDYEEPQVNNELDATAYLVDKLMSNAGDKHFKRFVILLSVIVVLLTLPFLLNASAKIVRSAKNLRRALRE